MEVQAGEESLFENPEGQPPCGAVPRAHAAPQIGSGRVRGFTTDVSVKKTRGAAIVFWFDEAFHRVVIPATKLQAFLGP